MGTRRLLSAFAVGVLAVATAVAGSSVAHAATRARYVALGDSYSAGSGVWPPDPSAPLICLRSSSNYPHVIASAIGDTLTDVTCGGAKTEDFTKAQRPGVPPQLDAVTAQTDLVTMTIGGNDNNTFIDAIVECGSLGVVTAGVGSPCKDTYGSTFDDQIDNGTYPALVHALEAVKAKAPHATIAILGYPWILPASGGCFPKMPVARGDVPYLHELQAHLDGAIEKAAARTGVTYVDMSQVSEGHDACQPIGTRWIEPVLFGTQVVPVHPNALGESEMAMQTMRTLHMN